jgi:hypothetical protein
MSHEFCGKPVEERIRSSSSLSMDKQLLNHTGQLTNANSNLPQILNRDLRPVFEDICESFSYQFSVPVYAVQLE